MDFQPSDGLAAPGGFTARHASVARQAAKVHLVIDNKSFIINIL
jgi:hypothetical protein